MDAIHVDRPLPSNTSIPFIQNDSAATTKESGDFEKQPDDDNGAVIFLAVNLMDPRDTPPWVEDCLLPLCQFRIFSDAISDDNTQEATTQSCLPL